MKKKLIDLLKGRFLVNEDAVKNWRFIVFSAFLVLIMIGSSHKTEEKVYYIGELDKKTKELRSEYVDLRSRLMKMKMESTVVEKMKERGLKVSEAPPKKIKVVTE